MNADRRKQIADASAKIDEARAQLEAVRDDEQTALDNLPESLQASEKGEAMLSATNMTTYDREYVHGFEPEPELFDKDNTPFNLRGEPLREEPNAEGEARAKAERDYAQERAQRSLFECGGTFNGFSCGSDADPGL